jgi:signal transduction histidine kinase
MSNTRSERATQWRRMIFVSPVQWRVRFLAVTSLLFFAEFALGVHDARRDPTVEPFQALPFFLVSLICSGIVVGFCWVLNRPRKFITNAWISALWFGMAIILATLLLVFMRSRVFPPPFIPEPIDAYSTVRLLVILISDIVTSFIIIFLVDALARVLDERRSTAERAAEQAARFQQQLLLAEEESRSLVSRYLHDNVQAHMIRVGAQLGRIAESLPAQDAAMITSVRDVLEEVRGIDLQGAVRALTPNLEASGLTESLLQLASGYESVVEIEIYVDSVLDRMDADATFKNDGPSITLAIYRIVEQALLNSIKHGQARCITVRVELREASQVRIDVSDDGKNGSSVQGPTGGGLATIDGWARVFNGSWDLTIAPSQGAHLRVELSGY